MTNYILGFEKSQKGKYSLMNNLEKENLLQKRTGFCMEHCTKFEEAKGKMREGLNVCLPRSQNL